MKKYWNINRLPRLTSFGSQGRSAFGLFVILLSCIVSFSVQGYEQTSEDKELIFALNKQLSQLVTTKKSPLFTQNLLTSLAQISQTQSDPRIQSILQSATSFLREMDMRKKDTVLKQKKSDLVRQYGSAITSSGPILATCLPYYSMVDDFAATHNLPTALIMTTWWKESRCRYTLPDNGDGIFQVISAAYGTGPLTAASFQIQLNDYAAFVHNKWNRYNRSNTSSGYVIDLQYADTNFTGVWNHAVLYNALSGSIRNERLTPKYPNYVQGNLYSGANVTTGAVTDGLVTYYMKFLDWEVKNWYY